MQQSLAQMSTFVDLLQWRSKQKADERLFTFLIDGEKEESHLTYQELDRQAKAIAAALQRRGLAGQCALLLYPPGLDYIAAFFGCIYAGVIAVPVYPPDPMRLERSLPRLQSIVKDAGVTTALTTESLLAMTEFIFEQAPDLKTLQWLATDRTAQETDAAWQRPAVTPDSLVFLQYTSGSTGTPKGVMVSHRNLIYNSSEIHRMAAHHPKSVFVSWLPNYHDMGLIGGILQPLYAGCLGVLMSPLAFLQRPIRWLEAISRFRGTSSPFPNFALDLCVRKFNPKNHPDLDLSSWEVACNGAEPIRPKSLEAFAETFAPYGFRREAMFPAYGLAEGTLIVTGGSRLTGATTAKFSDAALGNHLALERTDDDSSGQDPVQTRHLVSCGRSLVGQSLLIVDPETCTACKPNEVGEIWVAGPSVAQGYWNRSAETEACFRAYLADTGAGPFLRTGDLGFLRNGELFVTGRLKDMIIICGKNHYPQDIELTIEQSHPALRPGCGAAFSIDWNGEERLVVATELERRFASEDPPCERRRPGLDTGGEVVRMMQAPDIPEVLRAVRMAVAQRHDLPVHTVLLLKAGSIPKTSSGKIQRHACKSHFLASRLQTIAVDSIGEPLVSDPPRSVYVSM